MASFQYNPYTQPPRPSPVSAEESLKQLLRINYQSLNPPSTSVVQPIWDQIVTAKPGTFEWTVDLAQGLAALVLALMDPFLSPGSEQVVKQIIPDGSLGTFCLLTSAMEDWSDDLMYVALLQEIPERDHPRSLLDILFHLVISGNDGPVHDIALVALGTAYRSMDRLHQYLTLDPYRPDTSWWLESLDEENASKLTSVAVQNLLKR
jgi:hypothetical protein